MLCESCCNFEVFGDKEKDEFYNKCALLDIYNLNECYECEDYQECKEQRMQAGDGQTDFL